MECDASIGFRFDERGRVVSLSFGGVEFASPGGAGIFAAQLRDFVGNPLTLAAEDFQTVRRGDGGDGAVEFHFSECSRLPGTGAAVTVRTVGGELRWQISVTPGSEMFQVEWIDFPRIRLRRFLDGRYLLPIAEGALVEDLEKRELPGFFRCLGAEYPLGGVFGFYPGSAAMQFEAFYTREAGLCFICRDAAHSPKCIDIAPDGDAARIFMQHFTGGENSVGYEVAVAGFRGDWMDAAELYRDWMEHDDPTLPAALDTRIPRWLAESPVVLIYPVKGTGLDRGGLEPNEYFPYSAALPVVSRYRERWHGGIMALLMHWEGTAPWAPPYIWPPAGGEEMLAEFVAGMHAAGDTVGLYASGIGWTQQSTIDPGYDRTAQFEAEHLEHEVCTGPRGEAFSRICNGPFGQRIGYDLCAARKFTADTVANEIAAAARLGVDYLQYFDQDQGGSAPLCYSKRHGHPWLPGAWHTAAMRSLLDVAGAAAGGMVIGCENAAAEPYLGVCRLNDLRNQLAWGACGTPVPLYPYLFHEYAAGFSGNGCCVNQWVDIERTPFFLQWVVGWNFAYGNLISVVLKDGGDIHWNWIMPWSVAAPAQEPLIELIGNLTAWRRGRAADYLVAGRMEKPPRSVCGFREIYQKQRAPVRCPAVEVSAWSKNGRRAVLLVNCGDKPEACRIDWEETVSGTVLSRDGAELFAAESRIFTVPPLDALLLELEAQAQPPEYHLGK